LFDDEDPDGVNRFRPVFQFLSGSPVGVHRASQRAVGRDDDPSVLTGPSRRHAALATRRWEDSVSPFVPVTYPNTSVLQESASSEMFQYR